MLLKKKAPEIASCKGLIGVNQYSVLSPDGIVGAQIVIRGFVGLDN